MTQKAESGFAINFLFQIPPGAKNHKVTSKAFFMQARSVIAEHDAAHAHAWQIVPLRGDFSGRKPRSAARRATWDFNWQIDYILAQLLLDAEGLVALLVRRTTTTRPIAQPIQMHKMDPLRRTDLTR